MTRKKASKKQRHILIAALLLALVIVAGGTFAWFTSKDEVTNRLTASNSYGVSITESFTPQTQWLPGEEVNKDVSVVNTGNIDAFVRVSLSNALTLTVEGEGISVSAYEADDSTLTLDNCVEISDEERVALQAGGVLVCAAGEAVDDVEDQIEAGTGYTPEESGLYIFRRTVATDENGDETYEYAGYYVVVERSADGNITYTYYALKSDNDSVSDSVNDTITRDEETGKWDATLQTTTTLYAQEPELDYSKLEDDGNVIVATYKIDGLYDEDNEDGTYGTIVINIYLDEDWSTNWTLIDETFYYNAILEAGEQSAMLVDAVELDGSVTNEAYFDFTYDLTVALDSVQITADDDQTTAVNAAWEEVKATVPASDTADEDSVKWEKAVE